MCMMMATGLASPAPHHRPLPLCMMMWHNVWWCDIMYDVTWPQVWHRRPSPPPFALQVICSSKGCSKGCSKGLASPALTTALCAAGYMIFTWFFIFIVFKAYTCMALTSALWVRCRFDMILYMIFYFYFYLKPVHVCLASPARTTALCAAGYIWFCIWFFIWFLISIFILNLYMHVWRRRHSPGVYVCMCVYVYVCMRIGRPVRCRSCKCFFFFDTAQICMCLCNRRSGESSSKGCSKELCNRRSGE